MNNPESRARDGRTYVLSLPEGRKGKSWIWWIFMKFYVTHVFQNLINYISYVTKFYYKFITKIDKGQTLNTKIITNLPWNNKNSKFFKDEFYDNSIKYWPIFEKFLAILQTDKNFYVKTFVDSCQYVSCLFVCCIHQPSPLHSKLQKCHCCFSDILPKRKLCKVYYPQTYIINLYFYFTINLLTYHLKVIYGPHFFPSPYRFVNIYLKCTCKTCRKLRRTSTFLSTQ